MKKKNWTQCSWQYIWRGCDYSPESWGETATMVHFLARSILTAAKSTSQTNLDSFKRQMGLEIN